MSAVIFAVVKGLESLKRKVDAMNAAVQKNVATVLKQGAIDIQRHAIKSIQQPPKSGHIYKTRTKAGRQKAHQASAPGEAPAADGGELARGILVTTDEGGKVAFVTSHASYSSDLEFGTKRMKARPFMHPAFVANAPRIHLAVIAAYRGSKPKN